MVGFANGGAHVPYLSYLLRAVGDPGQCPRLETHPAPFWTNTETVGLTQYRPDVLALSKFVSSFSPALGYIATSIMYRKRVDACVTEKFAGMNPVEREKVSHESAEDRR